MLPANDGYQKCRHTQKEKYYKGHGNVAHNFVDGRVCLGCWSHLFRGEVKVNEIRILVLENTFKATNNTSTCDWFVCIISHVIVQCHKHIMEHSDVD